LAEADEVAEFIKAADIEIGLLFHLSPPTRAEEPSARHIRCVRRPLLDAREAIESPQDLLDNKHIKTAQIYDNRRRSVRDSASHKVPI
jgi:hypothetical protein